MAATAVHVKGLPQLERALKQVDKDLVKGIDRRLKEIGDVVAEDERSYLGGIGASRKSIGGIRPRLSGYGRVAVQQRYGTVTGRRGDWGARVYSSLYRAAIRRMPDTERKLEELLNQIASRNGF